MYKTLFKINEKNLIILDQEALNLIPSLKKISQKDLLFIILAYDYQGPFKRLDQAERVRRAMRRAYGKDEVNITERLQKYIDEYSSLQYDERRETVKVYRTKIGMLRLELMSELQPNKIKIIGETINYLQKETVRLEEEIDKEEELIMLASDGSLSMIEKYQLKMKQFRKDKDQRSELRAQIEAKKTKPKSETQKIT